MSDLKLSDLQSLGLTLTIVDRCQLHVKGTKKILTPQLLKIIANNKFRLINQLEDSGEHVNDVNKYFELVNQPDLHVTSAIDYLEQNSIDILPQHNKINELEITHENRKWIEVQLDQFPLHFREKLMRKYSSLYVQAADQVPERLSHRRANAGTAAGNDWLRRYVNSEIEE